MKKLILIMAVVLAGFTTTQAGNGESKNLGSIIRNNLKIPTELKGSKLNEKVNVQFKIKEDGKAEILNVETQNPELKNYIIQEFPKIDFNTDSTEMKGPYFIDINFKVI